MSAADVLALEGMGFRFRMDGDRVTRRCYGTPPPEAAAVLARVTREDVRRVLTDRAAGFTTVCAEALVVRYAPLVRAAAAAGGRPELWHEITEAFEQAYLAGDRAGALDGLAELERLHRDAMRGDRL